MPFTQCYFGLSRPIISVSLNTLRSSRVGIARVIDVFKAIYSLSLSLSIFFPPLPSHNISPLHGGRVKWFEKLGWKLQLNLQAIAICDGTATFGQPWQTNGRKRNVIERVSGRVTISIRSSLLNSFLIINPEIPPLFLLPQSACCALLFELTKWTRKG